VPIYSDLNQFTPTQKVLVEDLDSIYQSISSILSTPKNTRLFLPEFGSEIEAILFEPMDEITTNRLYDYIIEAIERWEPRVRLDLAKSSVVANYEQHTYNVVLNFVVLGLDDNLMYQYVGLLNQLDPKE
jgi:phage baseplate assembly protein W